MSFPEKTRITSSSYFLIINRGIEKCMLSFDANLGGNKMYISLKRIFLLEKLDPPDTINLAIKQTFQLVL